MRLTEKRWIAEVTYSTVNGIFIKDYIFDEMSQLDNFIEGFVDFRMIISIHIVPGSIQIEV